jgi:hypothetical protein
MKPRRRTATITGDLRWELERDERIARCVASGLGVRPREWWLHESGSPDLVVDEGHDIYADLRAGVHLENAKTRLRMLDATGELRPSERVAIATGTDRRFEWRREVLSEGRRNRP